MTRPPLCISGQRLCIRMGRKAEEQGLPLLGTALCGKGSGGGLCSILHEAVEDGGDLCSCGVAGGQEAAFGAVDQLFGDCQLSGALA